MCGGGEESERYVVRLVVERTRVARWRRSKRELRKCQAMNPVRNYNSLCQPGNISSNQKEKFSHKSNTDLHTSEVSVSRSRGQGWLDKTLRKTTA